MSFIQPNPISLINPLALVTGNDTAFQNSPIDFLMGVAIGNALLNQTSFSIIPQISSPADLALFNLLLQRARRNVGTDSFTENNTIASNDDNGINNNNNDIVLVNPDDDNNIDNNNNDIVLVNPDNDNNIDNNNNNIVVVNPDNDNDIDNNNNDVVEVPVAPAPQPVQQGQVRQVQQVPPEKVEADNNVGFFAGLSKQVIDDNMNRAATPPDVNNVNVNPPQAQDGKPNTLLQSVGGLLDGITAAVIGKAGNEAGHANLKEFFIHNPTALLSIPPDKRPEAVSQVLNEPFLTFMDPVERAAHTGLSVGVDGDKGQINNAIDTLTKQEANFKASMDFYYGFRANIMQGKDPNFKGEDAKGRIDALRDASGTGLEKKLAILTSAKQNLIDLRDTGSPAALKAVEDAKIALENEAKQEQHVASVASGNKDTWKQATFVNPFWGMYKQNLFNYVYTGMLEKDFAVFPYYMGAATAEKAYKDSYKPPKA